MSAAAREAAGTRIAIAQVRMHGTVDANLDEITRAMVCAQARGAVLCAFAELALPGFHRGIVALAQPGLIDPAVALVQALAARLGLGVAMGAPSFGPADTRLNSHLLIDEHGRLAAAVHKNGLTAPEATFFQPGHERPSARLHGIACSAVICREIEDQAQVLAQLGATAPALLFWPGQMRPDPALPLEDPPRHVVQAQALAHAARAWIVQTNWPNALNRPEEGLQGGRSACIAPDGELLFRLPQAESGLGVFTLGERCFEWHPQ